MSAPLNPSAFPQPYERAGDGMTLRDWFAGQTAPEFAKAGPQGHAPAHMVAAAAYELADAMLDERAKVTL